MAQVKKSSEEKEKERIELTEALVIALGLKYHNCTLATPEANRMRVRMLKRMQALGHTETCSRCGGTGHYMYCPGYGTICFKCNGATFTIKKLTPKLIDTVKLQVANGELKPYFEEQAKLKAEQEAKKGEGNAVL